MMHTFSFVTRCIGSSRARVGPLEFAKAGWKGFEMAWVSLFSVFTRQLEARLKCVVSYLRQL